jgi:hypothetical protein
MPAVEALNSWFQMLPARKGIHKIANADRT